MLILINCFRIHSVSQLQNTKLKHYSLYNGTECVLSMSEKKHNSLRTGIMTISFHLDTVNAVCTLDGMCLQIHDWVGGWWIHKAGKVRLIWV